MKQKKQRLLLFIIFLSFLGVIISGYLVNVHYSSKSSFCDIGKGLSCSIVNRSRYAEVLGIPVSILGVFFYSVLGILAFSSYKRNRDIETNKNRFIRAINHPKIFLVIALPALIFSFYLTFAEFFIIGSTCILCLISQGTILGIVLVGHIYYRLEKGVLKF